MVSSQRLMPVFNSKADVCIGLGRYWYDDGPHTIAQECNTIKPGCVIGLSNGEIIADEATTNLQCNGKLAWAYVPYNPNGPNPIQTKDWLKRLFPDRVPECLGPDNSLCLRPHSNAFAEVIEQSGHKWTLASVDVFDVQLLGNGRAIYRIAADPQKIHTFPEGSFTIPQPEKGYGNYFAIEVEPNRFELLYQSYDGGCLVFKGRVIKDGVSFYRPCVGILGNLWHFTYSVEPQEYNATPPVLKIPDDQFQYLETIEHRLSTPIPIPPDPPEPPDPIPEPEPPIPEPVIKEIEEFELMDPEIVSLVAFDHYARVVGNKLVFDQLVEGPLTDFEISKPDDRFAIKKDGKFVGVDSTIHMQSPMDQYYVTNSRGNYESFFIGVTPNGLIVAFVEYIQQGANNTVPFISVPLTIKRHG